jgi:hypothetical protein
MIFDLGDGVELRHEVRDADGVLTSATVTCVVTAPDGTTSTPVITETSAGVYDAAAVVANQAGRWTYVWNVSGTVVDVAPGEFYASVSAPQTYISLPVLREAAQLKDGSRDRLLLMALNAASRAIDDHTGRRFYADTTDTARTFPLRHRIARDDDGELLLVDDIASLAGLAVETGSAGSNTWTALDADVYETDPLNAMTSGQPITGLRTFGNGWSAVPRGRVRVTARWGWPVVPDVVAQATLLQASRLFKRLSSPEGVAGSAEWGTVRISRIDPDVQALVKNLVLPGFA